MTSQIEGASDEASSASEDLPGSAIPASNLLCAVAPTNPTSIVDIIAALRGIDALHGLADHEYHWLASHGSERVADVIGSSSSEKASLLTTSTSSSKAKSMFTAAILARSACSSAAPVRSPGSSRSPE